MRDKLKESLEKAKEWLDNITPEDFVDEYEAFYEECTCPHCNGYSEDGSACFDCVFDSDESSCVECGSYAPDGGYCDTCLDKVDLDEYEERRRKWLQEQQEY